MEHKLLTASSVKSDESNDISTACLAKHSTQNSTDFSQCFDSDNNQKAGDSDQNECTCSDEVTAIATTPSNKKFSSSLVTETSQLLKNSIIYFDDFNNKATILSPISELSFAWTKLVSTSDVMGKCVLTGTL